MVAHNITPTKHRIVAAMYRHFASDKDLHGFIFVMVGMTAIVGFVTQTPLVYVGFPLILVAGVLVGTFHTVQKELSREL